MTPDRPERWAVDLVCSRTGAVQALDEAAFLSPAGAPLLVRHRFPANAGRQLAERLPRRPWTLWRYRELLPLRQFDRRVDLGEGGTPLVRLREPVHGVRLWMKVEAGNPTGSFKDRGMAVAINRARELGAPGVELASAGNAAISLAAYAAAAGLPWRVALPADTPPRVRERCRSHGGEVLAFPGTLVEAGERLSDDPRGYWNVSTLREPYRVEGKKTMGLELAEQFGWRLPDWIVYPTGGGTGIIGMRKAFDELQQLGLLRGERQVRFAAVQMAGCAPIVRAFEGGQESAEPWPDPDTRVWGLRVPRALGDFLILDALRRGGGAAVAVEEEAVAPRQRATARRFGLTIGPEGAVALEGALRLIEGGTIRAGERVVVFQTGHPGNYA